MIRVLQVSDSHLSGRTPLADTNWQAVIDHVAETRPDLVVHTGDISLNGATDPDDLDYARRKLGELDQLGVEWLAVPGNHDIGDLSPTRYPITPERVAQYRSVFGEGFWSKTLDGWQLVGLDVQTLANGDAEDWWAWLAGELTSHDGPSAVFLHRPLAPHGYEDTAKRYVPEPARARLVRLLDDAGVTLVGSGHVHQWRTVPVPGRSEVWAPATWAVLPDRVQPLIGTKVAGVVEHQLSETATSTLLVPDGMRTMAIEDDIPSPYG